RFRVERRRVERREGVAERARCIGAARAEVDAALVLAELLNVLPRCGDLGLIERGDDTERRGRVARVARLFHRGGDLLERVVERVHVGLDLAWSRLRQLVDRRGELVQLRGVAERTAVVQ